jgi:hypothetical protein
MRIAVEFLSIANREGPGGVARRHAEGAGRDPAAQGSHHDAICREVG